MSAKDYKPVMKHLKSVDEIPLPCIATVKIDGEFQLVTYENGKTEIENRFGRTRTDRELPCLYQLSQDLLKTGIRHGLLLAELYAVDEKGKPLNLPKFLSASKGKDQRPQDLRLGVFDLMEINEDYVSESYRTKLELMNEEWFKTEEPLQAEVLVHTVPYALCNSRESLRDFWNIYVTKHGFEGVVARTDRDIYKVKPVQTIDAVIVGLNKREKWKDGLVTSIKTAVMTSEGNYLVVTDVASGIDHQLRKALMELTKYKVQEDKDCLWVQPIVVVEIEYTETYEASKPLIRLSEVGYWNVGMAPYYSLREPRLIRFRQDKKPIPEDISKDQIG